MSIADSKKSSSLGSDLSQGLGNASFACSLLLLANINVHNEFLIQISFEVRNIGF